MALSGYRILSIDCHVQFNDLLLLFFNHQIFTTCRHRHRHRHIFLQQKTKLNV